MNNPWPDPEVIKAQEERAAVVRKQQAERRLALQALRRDNAMRQVDDPYQRQDRIDALTEREREINAGL